MALVYLVFACINWTGIMGTTQLEYQGKPL